MKKVVIKKRVLDVISEEEYLRRSRMNPESVPDMQQDTAIMKDGYIYPLNPQLSQQVPGVHDNGPMLVYTKPNEENDDPGYHSNNIIDFDNVNSLKDSIDRQNELDQAERSILITPDNIFMPVIKETDSPEMKLFKEAVRRKQIDLNAYKARFGAGFNNDKRSFNDPTITFAKMKRICTYLDMKISLAFEDNPGAPNPIGEKLVTVITQENDGEE